MVIEIIFLNDNQYFYAYLYWGKCPLGHISPPPLQNHYTNFFFNFYFIFYFRCTLYIVTNKSQKCFFISISVLGRSGDMCIIRNNKLTM